MRIPTVEHAPPDLAGQRVAVLGAARSGIGCAMLLASAGAETIVGDIKAREDLDRESLDRFVALGAQLRFGVATLPQFGAPDLLIVSPGVPFQAPVAREAREAGLPVMGEVELAYRFSRRPVMAVAGTNAKGTTCTLLRDMLNAGGVRATLCGNIGNPFSGAVAAGGDTDVYVVEISSFQLETIDQFRPWVGLLLNIQPDHLDRHGSFEAYRAAKSRLFDNQTPEDWAVLNAADPNVLEAAETARSRRITFAAGGAAADARVEGETLVVDVGDGPLRVCRVGDLVRAGRPYIESALAAAAAALIAGATPTGLLEAIRHHKLPSHVLDVVCETDGVTFINSSKATNPAAAQADLESVSGPVLLIAGGVEKDADFAEFGAFVRERVKALFLIGQCGPRIAGAAVGVPATHCASLEEAVRLASEAAIAGDSVVLAPACASQDMFRDYKDRGERFREAARRVCEARRGSHEPGSGGSQP